MENEYMKRGYLLPEGCKDLSDVAKLKQKHAAELLLQAPPHKGSFYKKTWKSHTALPPLMHQVFVSPPTSVRKLADLLGQTPFKIIGDLMQLGVFATIDQIVDFKTVSVIARKYGFEAIKAG
jgi:hypothetical protein